MDVGLYRTHVVPPIVPFCCGTAPSELAGGPVSDSPVPVERVALDGARLPLADDSVDSALEPMGYLYEGVAVT